MFWDALRPVLQRVYLKIVTVAATKPGSRPERLLMMRAS